MPAIYCSECGSKLDFVINPPKFCNNCGFSFEIKASSPPKKSKRKIEFEVEDDDNQRSYAGLAFEVEGKPSKLMLEDLVKQKKTGHVYGAFGAGNIKPGEELLKDIVRECNKKTPIEDGGE